MSVSTNLDFDFNAILPSNTTQETITPQTKPITKLIQPPKKTSASELKEVNKFLNNNKKETKATKKPSDTVITASERTRLTIMIHRYHNSKRFAPLFKELGIKKTILQLKKLDNDGLRQYLQNMNLAIDNRSNEDALESMAAYSLKATENVLCAVGVDVSGVTNQLTHNDDYLDSLEHVRLENSDLIHMSATKRLSLTIVKSFSMAYYVNKQRKSIALDQVEDHSLAETA